MAVENVDNNRGVESGDSVSKEAEKADLSKGVGDELRDLKINLMGINTAADLVRTVQDRSNQWRELQSSDWAEDLDAEEIETAYRELDADGKEALMFALLSTFSGGHDIDSYGYRLISPEVAGMYRSYLESAYELSESFIEQDPNEDNGIMKPIEVGGAYVGGNFASTYADLITLINFQSGVQRSETEQQRREQLAEDSENASN
jgi:hypothetical protein